MRLCRRDLQILLKSLHKNEAFKGSLEKGELGKRERENLREKDGLMDAINCIAVDDGEESFGEEMGLYIFVFK